MGLAASLGLLLGAAGCRPAPPRAIVLIVVDTLRADHLGVYGYERPTSPQLDAWAAGGAVFEHAFSSSPWTLPTFGTLFTGRLPSRHLAGTFTRSPDGRRPDRNQFRRLDDALPTLAEAARQAGFTTAAVVNNWFLGPRFGVDRGFESYDWAPAGNKRLRRADVVVDRTLGWLRTHGREPFFLVVHFFDPHMEYDPPPATRGRFSSALPDNGLPRVTERIRATMRRGEAFDRDYVVALYDEEILFVDRELGRLFRALEGLDALVLLTSDHGEELFDHGEFEHGHSVYNELLRVPLIVRGPSIPPGRHRTPVSLLDVFPTVLATLGLTAPQELPGLSLWPVLRGGSLPDRLLYAERTLWGPERQAIIRWPHKLTRRADTNRIQLFDLEADFAERQDMVAKHSEDAEQLRLLLAASLAAASSAHPGEEVELDGELLDELRALGYVR